MADAALDGPWAPENIPDDDGILLRVLRSNFDFENDEIKPVGFKNHGDGMSTDWEKYSSAEQTRARCPEDKSPEDYGVVRLIVGFVRRVPYQSVMHTPKWCPPHHKHTNRAHTDVFGPKGSKDRYGDPPQKLQSHIITDIRLRLNAIAKDWPIPIADETNG